MIINSNSQNSIQACSSEPTQAADDQQNDERIRVRELLRYFQPEASNAGTGEESRVANDQSLTALAQLAAWKLNCQRSFISLVDHNKQYIIAEATRTVSLNSDADYEGENDAIFLGPTTLDLIWGMCAATIPTFTSTDGSLNIISQYMKTDKEKFVIHDMSQVDEYKDRPYVAGWPHMRFYAEVPIISPTGLCIGSICTVDDKPRDEFKPREMAMLQEISNAVMNHLQFTMSHFQRQRAQQMIRGLGSFATADSSSNTIPKPITSDHEAKKILDEPVTAVSTTPDSEISGEVTDTSTSEELKQETTKSTSSKMAIFPQSHKAANSTLEVERTLPDMANRLKNAADLMREAMDLDGIILFDRRKIEHEGDPATKWAVSCLEVESASQFNPSNQLLTLLIRSLPYGGVLYFDSDGDCDSYVQFEALTSMGTDGVLRIPNKLTMENAKTIDSGIPSEVRIFSQMLSAQALILCPVRAASVDVLFAYAVGFTSSEARIFQLEDLSYFASFSNLLTLEVSRLEISAADRTKSEFISSLSHELRSPLHGILASADLLKDYLKDPIAHTIFSTIDACGSTLIDTLDNLLTFGKLNNSTVNRRGRRKQLDGESSELTLRKDLSEHPAYLDSTVDLNHLVEEVMISSIAGRQSHSDVERTLLVDHFPLTATTSTSTVVVICDLQTAGNWKFYTHRGSWRRIIMNLVGNSLKYTSEGFVRVRLRYQNDDNDDTFARAILTVEDTGCGISESFLAERLYKPFQQEDSLQPGTGLGLSIVRQLVESLSGQIEITSRVKIGTTVTLSVKLDRTHDTPLSSSLAEIPSHIPKRLPECAIGFLGFDPLAGGEDAQNKDALRIRALHTSITFALKNYGHQVVNVSSLASRDVGVFILPEDVYRATIKTNLESSTVPIILLCSGGLDYREAAGGLFYLSPPFGPKNLAQALEYCANYMQENLVSKSDTGLSVGLAKASDDSQIRRSDAFPASTQLPIRPKAGENVARPVTVQRKALLVEDNPINLSLLVMFMKKLEFSYQTAANGQEAIDLYRSAHGAFDVIITDIQMPRKDGLIASAEIRQFEQEMGLEPTQIIAITGLGLHDQASTSCINQWLTKPVTLKTLKDVLDLCLPHT